MRMEGKTGIYNGIYSTDRNLSPDVQIITLTPLLFFGNCSSTLSISSLSKFICQQGKDLPLFYSHENF